MFRRGVLLAAAACAAAEEQRVVAIAWGDDSIRVQAVPSGAALPQALHALLPLDPAPEPVDLTPGGPGLSHGNMKVQLTASGTLTFSRVDDGSVLLSETVPRSIAPRAVDALHDRYAGTTLYNVKATFDLTDGERVYGMGQHTHGSLNNRGQAVANVPGAFLPVNTEVFIPFVVSSRRYGYLHNYPGLGAFAWGDSSTNWTANAAQSYDIWVTTDGGGNATTWSQQIMRRYADATGHAPTFPSWATGLWQSKNRYQTQDELLSVAREYQRRNLSISVMVIDYFSWSPQWTAGDYRFDSTCWPDPKGMISELEAMGIKLMVSTYANFINNQSIHFAEAQEQGDIFVVQENGTAVTDGFQWSQVYDLFNEKARAFMYSKLRETYVDMGVRVFWQDCDEYCTTGGSAPDSWNKRVYYPSAGIDEAVAGAYPMALAQAFKEGFQSDNISDGIQLGRSAWAGSQRYGSALWSGDIGSRWDALKMSIPAGLNAGMSGIVWWTTDVGGYGGSHGRAMNTTDPDAQELMVRWVQFGAFCPLFRIHGYRAPTLAPSCKVCTGFSCDQGHETAAWAYGDQAFEAIARMIELRNSLHPYIESIMADASKDGTPLMRPMWFEFPGDAACATKDVEETQFMFGPKYLVAPVTDLGNRSRAVHFPAETEWRHIYTGAVLKGGGTVEVDVPYDTPAVYERIS